MVALYDSKSTKRDYYIIKIKVITDPPIVIPDPPLPPPPIIK